VVHIPLPENFPGMFQVQPALLAGLQLQFVKTLGLPIHSQDFYMGFGGPCARMLDNQSYWCQPYGGLS
jgi:hypothetical protein